MMPTLLLVRRSCGQRGIAAVGAVIFLLLVVMLVLSQTIAMTASNVTDTLFQSQSVNALLATESGLERAVGILNNRVIDTTISNTTCTGEVGPVGTTVAFPAGSTTSSFTYAALTSTPATCTGTACTGCAIRVVGKSGDTSRTVNLSIALSAGTSGGAAGCGGGGGGGGGGCTEANIIQTISTVSVPTILMSNLAFRRHPGGGGNVSATGCVVISGGASTNCITQWTEESSSGQPAIGGRGASALISTAGTYSLQQNLSADSPYAGSGGRIGQAAGKTLSIVGSYWGESTPQTTSNSSATTGATRNGAAFDPAPVTSPGRPASTTPAIGTTQASESWCYGGDTMVMGFSGRSNSNANGTITSFQFGNAPVSMGLHVSNAFIQYPTPAGSVNSDVYSDLWYLYNPGYMSAAGGAMSSGATFTGTVGTTASATAQASGAGVIGATFIGTIAKDSFSITVAGANNTLRVNDVISCGGGCGVNNAMITAVVGATVTVSPKASKAETNTVMTAKSTTLTLSGVTVPFATGNISGAVAGTTITVPGLTGGNGNYTVSGPAQYLAPGSALTGSTLVLNVSAVPSAGTFSTGDTLSRTGAPNFASITFPIANCAAGVATTGSGGVGRYCLSSAQNFVNTPVTAPSNLMTVTTLPGSVYLEVGDSVSGTGVTAASILNQVTGASGGTGTYGLNGAAQYVASTAGLVTTLTGGNVRVPVGSALPSVGTLITRRTYNRDSTLGTVGQVGVGIGQFPANSIVTAVGTSKFTVSNLPSSPIVGATVCGGTCALFDHSSASSTTAFAVGVTNTTHWDAGMTCFKGVDPSTIHGLTGLGASATANSWHAPLNP